MWRSAFRWRLGLGIIGPLLVYQLDYELPLGVPDAFVPVLVSLVLAGTGLRSWRLARALREEIAVADEPLAPRFGAWECAPLQARVGCR